MRLQTSIEVSIHIILLRVLFLYNMHHIYNDFFDDVTSLFANNSIVLSVHPLEHFLHLSFAFGIIQGLVLFLQIPLEF